MFASEEVKEVEDYTHFSLFSGATGGVYIFLTLGLFACVPRAYLIVYL